MPPRRGGHIWPCPKKIMGKGEDLDETIDRPTMNNVKDAADVL
jgi:hypothetical protein